MMETISEKELETQVIDTIVALVNQAKTVTEMNTSIEEAEEYKVDKPATYYIGETVQKGLDARQKYNHLKEMKKSHFWTVGRNKAKAEKTQDVLEDIIDAVDNNANATKVLFNEQAKMANFSKKLYAIGVMGIAANRLVVREIKLRLEHASKEELTELARQELETLFKELMQQQRMEEKIDDIKKDITGIQTTQAERFDGMKAELGAQLADFKSETERLTASQEEFIKKSEEQTADALTHLEEVRKSDTAALHKEQQAMLSEIQKTMDTFREEQSAIAVALEKKLSTYKIVAWVAVALSVASVLYIALS